MAFRRFAHAITTAKDVEFDRWMDEIRSQNEGVVSKNRVNRVANVVLRKADPKQYLLSHATIVASVDTYSPKGVKTGRANNRGVQIEIRHPDFRIKPSGFDIINNNGDAWERSLLLSTYRTFIGAPNYLEHIQLPELSKGFIVDAISRDLGDTCYVDILVGTDRKHKKLVSDILSGEMSALSMGCISLFTICTKCGNVAVDDSQLCPCLQYDGKGAKFSDGSGNHHPVAELIGHVSVPNSNQFIEASWVKNPAFKGAVRRNFLNADSIAVASQINKASRVYNVRQKEKHDDKLKRAASIRWAKEDSDSEDTDTSDESDFDQDIEDIDTGDESDFDQDSGDDSGDDVDFGGGGLGGSSGGGSSGGGSSGGSEDGESETKSDSDGVDEMIAKAQDLILQTLVKSLEEKLKPKPQDVKTVVQGKNWESSGGNDNIVRSSEDFSRKLRKTFSSQKLIRWAENIKKVIRTSGVDGIKANKITAKDLIVLSWIEDNVNGRRYSPNLYKVAMKVGASSVYPSKKSFVSACKMRLGRAPTVEEQKFFIWKGKIASLAEF